MYHSCWITKDGKVELCPNPNDHYHVAAEHFDNDDGRADDRAFNAGWMKVSGYGESLDDVFPYIKGELTIDQKRAIRQMEPNVLIDELEETARENYRSAHIS